jgi:hypothetical protein
MASLWEILDPSNLRYNTELGLTTDDSGFGPPSGITGIGWIRTGHFASPVPPAGQANCIAWTSANSQHFGTSIYLNNNWESTDVRVVGPWLHTVVTCNALMRVWCVQD